MKKKCLRRWTGIGLVFAMLLSLSIPASAESVSPEWDRILKSLAVTNENYEKADAENRSKTSKIMEEILNNPNEMSISGEFKSAKNKGVEIPDSKAWSGCGIQASQKSDTASNTYLVEGSFNKNQNIIISGAFFMSEQLMAVTSKELLGDIYLGINPNTLTEDLKASPWGEDIKELTEQGIDLNGFFKAQNPKYKQEQFTSVLKKYSAIGKDVLQSNEAKKTGTAVIDLKGNKVSCDEYTITLKKEWVHSYFDKLAATFKNDTEFQELLLGQSGYGASSKLSKEFKNEINTAAGEFTKEIKTFITKDVLVNVYINDRDEIIKAAFKMQVNNEKDKAKQADITAEITLGDGMSLTNNMKLVLIVNDDKESLHFSCDVDQTKVNNENTISYQFKVAGPSNDEAIAVTAKAIYDESKTQDNVSLAFDVQSKDFKMGASAKGDLITDTSTASIKADFDEVKVSLAEDGNNFDVQLKGSVAVKKIDAKEVNINRNNVKMVLKMSDKELKALTQQAETNGTALALKMGSLFMPQSSIPDNK